LDGLSQLVFTVIGASGSGKTSLLAQALHEATGREGVTIFRFLGTTSTASDVSRLLADLINDICTEYQVDKNSLLLEGEDETKFSTLMGLQELLPRCLNLAGKEKPLLIVLDALDQLSRDFTTLSLDWIPKELPNHAKLIVSALPDLRDKLSQTVIHDLTAMPAPEGEELLTAWLNAVHRTLTPEQTRLVFDRFTPVGTPLYLKLAFENARKWHSYDTAQSLKADIAGVLDEFFAGLERVHGRTLLKTLCCYLLSGKYQGLMEQEILDLLVADEEYWLHFLDKCHLDHRQEVAELKRLPIVVWSRLFLDLEPYLTTRNADGLPIISFYHRKFSEYVKKEYLTDPLPWHVRIADHFDKAPLYLDDKEARPNVRKVVEQPWQQTLAQQWGEIVDKTLASFPFLMAKAKADMVEGILEDYAFLWGVATENTKLQLDLWRAFFAERTHILRRGNEELPAFKILLQLAVEHADDSLVTKGAEEWLKEERCNWLWLRRVQRLPHTHKGPCVAVLEGHTEGVRSALELTDGRLLSWSALDHTLRLWDGQTGACLMVLKGHSSWVWGALELLDGRILSWSDDGSLRLWDRQSGACIKMLIGHQGLVRGALELNDGRLLSWSDDGSSRLWDDQTGACLEILKHTNAIFCGLVLADDRILLRSKDKTLLLWYVQKSYCIALKGHSDLVNGTLIFSEWQIISWSDDKTLRLWDANNFGLCVKVFEGHTRSVKGALKLGEGQILSWSDDKTLRIWDVQSGKCLAIFEGHTDSVKGALKLGEGQILSWSDDNTLRIWDIQSGKCLAIFEGHTDSVKGAIKLGEGRILSWSFDRTLRLWDYEKCKVLAVLKGHSISVEGALELTDGRLLSWSMDKTLRLWDTKSDSNITVPKGHADSVEGALELADGRIISWSRDNDLLLWNCQSGTCLGVLTGHTNSVNGAMELANGRILSWSDDGSLRLWNTQNGECLAVQPGYAELILALSNGLLLSWTSRIQYALQLWDGESIAHKISLIGHKRPVNGALELKDGRILSWSQDSSMRLWDGQSGECLMGPIWSGTVIGALELADGRLLTWSEGATLQLWDGQSGASLAVLNGCTNPIEGALELTEGRILSWEWPVSTVRLWDSQNGNCLEVVAKDQIAKRYPEWIYDMQQSQNYRCISGDLFVGSTARVAYLRQKTTPSILTGWHAESDLVARCLLPDGTVVATEANGQVCFLKLHHGQRRVPLAEAEMLLPTLRKHAT
jgi:WD40 repeat protein